MIRRLLNSWSWKHVPCCVSYQDAVDVVSLQVGSGRLQEPPVAAFVVGDVGLHLVVLPLVGDQHAFNSGHLWDADRWYRCLFIF